MIGAVVGGEEGFPLFPHIFLFFSLVGVCSLSKNVFTYSPPPPPFFIPFLEPVGGPPSSNRFVDCFDEQLDAAQSAFG